MAKKATAKTLKVFRTSIGFHDAIVAAPSKKAALEAWGSKKDLFARGAAEMITDPELSRDALVAPGTVIKVSRGSVAQQLAALPAEAKAVSTKVSRAAQPVRLSKIKSQPKPSRASLEAAEKAVATATDKQAGALAKIVKQEAKLAEERRLLIEKQSIEMRRLTTARDEKRRAYDTAMAARNG